MPIVSEIPNNDATTSQKLEGFGDFLVLTGAVVGLAYGVNYAMNKKTGIGGYAGYGLLFLVAGTLIGQVGNKAINVLKS